ncbi:hypothetical protein TRICI_003963 [Trichomonascus ciferrii]|uniref:beta-glucosidase n=1 Tax=Trichomonascus ciferrii TaxID=44093 RepID=A0A642V2D1_9ASCO|nr:hypothetical protein TRICI_003963 [Trichomonascus ciferrii]
MYPYINSTDDVESHAEPLEYPKGYSTEQQASPSLAGGASGGNPFLFETAYKVQASVENIGERPGKEVAQLYIAYPQSERFPTPPKQLRGFEKVYLNNCEKKTVNFNIRVRDLSVWDPESGSWIIQRGTYQVYVGSSSRKLALHSEIVIQ